MNITLKSIPLKGKLTLPPSKSLLHRALICAYLSKNEFDLSSYEVSNDIFATKHSLEDFEQESVVNCFESGSTLRFLLPIACALGLNITFIGDGRLPERPLTAYLREFSKKGITFDGDKLPLKVSGQLQPGEYNIEGNISSQFISGLFFALPLLNGDSKIIVTEPHESKPYSNMTLACLRKCGIEILEDGNTYTIKGNQTYQWNNIDIEGDFSQAAFFLTANYLGSDIKFTNLPKNSSQGDNKIIEILEELKQNNISEINCTDVPDLVPILAVACCFAKKNIIINGAERLKIKESNRLAAITKNLNDIGGKITLYPDGLKIEPIEYFRGGIVDSYNDHRIAMSSAIAAQKSLYPITILNAECVGKSYPSFWDEIYRLKYEQ
ncbi:MAG: 3-phosphoshikimate 1-carboxyvinyltransferase [Oscillospiraceae bacterium]|jgi:3-phosphoshikimate 1-carboxyvinyltransferase|nr:3-phosphoshikimate 1-carboxyvinyltransferase [Oscillospiraceae bacterium]